VLENPLPTLAGEREQWLNGLRRGGPSTGPQISEEATHDGSTDGAEAMAAQR
jgi:hypothetical protein